MGMFVEQKDLIDARLSIQEPLMYVYFITVLRYTVKNLISVQSTVKKFLCVCQSINLGGDEFCPVKFVTIGTILMNKMISLFYFELFWHG
jgi:hypothetical protein